MNKKNILVTGGAGYIGSHTLVELYNSGFNPVVVDNLSNSSLNNIKGAEQIIKSKIDFFEVDCTDFEQMNKVFKEQKNIDAVIHFAAFDNNVDKLVWCIDHGGVPVNATAANGDTPLVDAVAQGSIEAAKALMMRGGTPGVNVLKQRAEREFERAVQEDQRFPNDRFNQERLVKAARMDAFLDGVLYSTGQPPLPPLPPSATALQGAVHGGHTAVVQLLLQQGADPASALDLAQAIGNQEIIALLTANQ